QSGRPNPRSSKGSSGARPVFGPYAAEYNPAGRMRSNCTRRCKERSMAMHRYFAPLSAALGVALLFLPTPLRAADMTDAARQFIEQYESTIRPLEISAARAWWDANVTGKDEDFAAKEEAERR